MCLFSFFYYTILLYIFLKKSSFVYFFKDCLSSLKFFFAVS